MHITSLLAFPLLLLAGGVAGCAANAGPPADYLAVTGRADEWSGGVRMIPVETPNGTFRVWTRRVGNNPRIRMLILHGGPGMSHEYLQAVDSYLPGAGIEYYHYDQLGSFRSDQPDDESLWQIDRFVEEVEQVRQALGLDRDDFYLYGHSWGGLLGIEYALKYQQHLKGLIVSNMMASIPEYNEYAEQVLMPTMDQDALAEVKRLEAAGDHGERYLGLLMEHHYTSHILRRPADQWPTGLVRTLEHINPQVYVLMKGPSELGASGRLAEWDRTADLGRIQVPTLVIGARHDTMDPAHLEWMAGAVQRGRYLHCEGGSHLAIYDDQRRYFDGLIAFVHDVDAGRY